LPQFKRFKHLVCRLDGNINEKLESLEEIEEMSVKLERLYWDCMEIMNNVNHDHNNNYNLILTRNFMIMAMRSCEGFKEDGVFISMNSLGFAGTMAVKNEESLELLKKKTPIKLLELVSIPTLIDDTNEDHKI
jgi:ATP adenylyltransferase